VDFQQNVDDQALEFAGIFSCRFLSQSLALAYFT
jgi:hypothetical protein